MKSPWYKIVSEGVVVLFLFFSWRDSTRESGVRGAVKRGKGNEEGNALPAGPSHFLCSPAL